MQTASWYSVPIGCESLTSLELFPRAIVNRGLAWCRFVILWLAAALIVKVAASVVLGYRDYLPPNFASDFLAGREAYFGGGYSWAFYAHVASGPLTLLFGLLLVSTPIRARSPRLHRNLGKAQIVLVVLVLAPSGLWMAPYAATGRVAAVGFAALAIATAFCAICGWRSAVSRRFAEHQQWMWRLFLLLCSAVVLRVVGGAATVIGADSSWSYPLAAWVSWLGPLAVFESFRARDAIHSGASAALSPPAIEMRARRTSAAVPAPRK